MSTDNDTKPEVVFALYQPHPGEDETLRKLIPGHLPALKKIGLITDRPALLVRSGNGTYIEIFEWVSKSAANAAHQHPEIAKIWEAMGQVADFPGLASLEEAGAQFPHFEVIDL